MRLATLSGRTAIETETLLFDLSQYQTDRYCGINPHVIDVGVDTDLEEERYLDRLHGKSVLEQEPKPPTLEQSESVLVQEPETPALEQFESVLVQEPETPALEQSRRVARGWLDTYKVKRKNREHLYYRYNWRECGKRCEYHIPYRKLTEVVEAMNLDRSIPEILNLLKSRDK